VSWLLTGGAGYIGSHVAHLFVGSGEKVVVLDNLRTGLLERVPSGADFVKADITSANELKNVFDSYPIHGVINLAALKSVEESSRLPMEYQEINAFGTKNLLDTAILKKASVFIQSSTAAVYGNPDTGIALESSAPNPISVYGSTKLLAESYLIESVSSEKIRGASLRYFNVVGAKNRLLMDKSVANLFPIVAKSLREGRPPVVFGGDYPTPDGTCIRDYIHVEDIANAHLLLARALEIRQTALSLNIGTGKGYSVLEVINAIMDFNEFNSEIEILGRREGDPASLIANADLAKMEIGFEATKGLTEMVETTFI
jgi:UDP-glucose 4-epimerase